jgi:hypothetical protein
MRNHSTTKTTVQELIYIDILNELEMKTCRARDSLGV